MLDASLGHVTLTRAAARTASGLAAPGFISKWSRLGLWPCSAFRRLVGVNYLGRRPVVEELGQRRPMAQRIVDGPGRGIGLGQQRALRHEPGLQCVGHGFRALLARQQSVLVAEVLDLALDLVELGDQRDGLARDLAAIELECLEQLPAGMGLYRTQP